VRPVGAGQALINNNKSSSRLRVIVHFVIVNRKWDFGRYYLHNVAYIAYCGLWMCPGNRVTCETEIHDRYSIDVSILDLTARDRYRTDTGYIYWIDTG